MILTKIYKIILLAKYENSFREIKEHNIFWVRTSDLAGLGLITVPTIAWIFAVEDVAKFALLAVIMQLTLSVGSLQLHQSYVREYYEQTDTEKLLNASVVPSIVILMIWTANCVVLSDAINLLIFEQNSTIMTICIITVCLANYVQNMIVHILRNG